MTWYTNESDLPDTPLERAIMLQNMLIALAENGKLDDATYSQLRTEFMSGVTRSRLPEYIRSCRNEQQLWAHLKQVASGSGSWTARRAHIFETFQPLLAHLEGQSKAPADPSITETLSSFDPDGVHRVWERALERREQDPEGAITVARTLLETVCKRILDEAGEAYEDDDLPKLYGKTSRVLNLAPSQYTEDAFRAILGGCHAVVQNLGTLGNRIGDAHGQGRNPVRPAPRHAALAVSFLASWRLSLWVNGNFRFSRSCFCNCDSKKSPSASSICRSEPRKYPVHAQPMRANFRRGTCSKENPGGGRGPAPGIAGIYRGAKTGGVSGLG